MTENKPKNSETPAPETEKAEGVSENGETKTEAKPKGEHKKEKEKEKETKAELVALRQQVSDLEKKLADATEAAKEQNDRYLRMMAEYDNFRRRSAKERESAYTDAAFDVLRDLLPVVDNLERAAASQGSEEQIREGLRMTLGAVETLLEKQGVTRFGEKGDTFDPNAHNAVMHEENPDEGEGVIADVFLPGYRKGDRVLRYAMVKVLN